MPRVEFTSQLKRFTHTPCVDTSATVLREALDAAFECNPRLRSYVLDEQGHLRPNVIVYIDGQASRDRLAQTDALGPDSRVYVLQALSGG